MQDAERARQIIEENIYAVLATASLDGIPWISPVFFAYDEAYNIYWVSNKDAYHSQLLRENPQVAIGIFNSHAVEGEGDGVYIKAGVLELSALDDVKHGSAVFNQRAQEDEFKIQNLAKVTGDGVWRLYRAAPEKVWKLGKGTHINGQYVDTRVPVDLLPN